MNEYLIKLYGWISSNDTTFTNRISESDFVSKMESNQEYNKKMYDWISSIDSSFSSRLNPNDFQTKTGLKKKVNSQSTSQKESTVSTTPKETQDGFSDGLNQTVKSPYLEKIRQTGYDKLSNDDKELFKQETYKTFARPFKTTQEAYDYMRFPTDEYGNKYNPQDRFKISKKEDGSLETIDIRDNDLAKAIDLYDKGSRDISTISDFGKVKNTERLNEDISDKILDIDDEKLNSLGIDVDDYKAWEKQSVREETGGYKFFKKLLTSSEGDDFEKEKRDYQRLASYKTSILDDLTKDIETLDSRAELEENISNKGLILQEKNKLKDLFNKEVSSLSGLIDKFPTYKKYTVTNELESRKKLYNDLKSGGIKEYWAGGKDILLGAGDAASNFAMNTIAAIPSLLDQAIYTSGGDKKGVLAGLAESFLDSAEHYSMDMGNVKRNSFIQGKPVTYNNQDFIVGDNGSVYDSETNILVNGVIPDNEISNIIDKSKDVKYTETNFDIGSGLSGMTSQLVNLIGLVRTGGKISKSTGVKAGVGMGAASYASTMASTVSELKDDIMAQGVSEKEANQKAIYFGNAIASLDGLFSGLSGGNEGLIMEKGIKDIIVNIAKKDGKDLTIAELKRKTKDLIKENAKELFIEEIPVLLSEKGINSLINESVGKIVRSDVVTKADLLETTFMTLGATTTLGSKKLLTNNQRNSLVKYVAENVDNLERLKNGLIEEGSLTAEEATSVFNDVNNMIYAENKVKGTIKNPENALEASELIKRRDELELKKKDLDPVLTSDIDLQIEDLNNQIKQIQEKDKKEIQDAIQKQTTDEGVLRQEQPELGLQEVVEEVVTEPTKEKVKDLFNRPVTLVEFGGSKLDTPIEGDMYVEGQQVVVEDANGNIAVIGNIDEISESTLEDLGIIPQESNVKTTINGNLQVGEDILVPTRDGIKRDKRGNISRVVLQSPDGSITRTLRGVDAEEAAYQILLKEATSPQQEQRINELLEQDEEFQNKLREATAVTETTTDTDTEQVNSKKPYSIEEVKETTDTAAFANSQAEAIAQRKDDKLQVAPLTQQDAQNILDEGGKLFMTEDGKAGAYVTVDGYMGGLFKQPGANRSQAAKVLQEASVKVGGKFFDAFGINTETGEGTSLEDIYVKNGFRPVARITFNPEFAPKGWEKTNLKNRPDNVFFVYDPNGQYNVGDGLRIEDYDKAYELAKNKANETKTKAGNRLFNEPLKAVKEIADRYYERIFKKERPKFEGTRQLDVERAKRISDAFEAMKNEPNNPEVRKAYEALAKETIEQYKDFVDAGYVVEINNEEPYANSGEMIDDLRNNKKIKIFSTESGFGDNAITEEQRAENPLLARTEFTDANGVPMLVNDLFRAIHDFYGHAELGNSFGPKGEENAWNVHARMFSPLARRAMTTETRGQNSYVNFSGVNEKVESLREKARKLREQGKEDEAQKIVEEIYSLTRFADQKVGLLPEEFSDINESEQTLEQLESEDKLLDWLDKAIEATSTAGKTFDATLGIPLMVVNSSLKIFKKTYVATKSLAKAIKAGADYLRSEGYKITDAEYASRINKVTRLNEIVENTDVQKKDKESILKRINNFVSGGRKRILGYVGKQIVDAVNEIEGIESKMSELSMVSKENVSRLKKARIKAIKEYSKKVGKEKANSEINKLIDSVMSPKENNTTLDDAIKELKEISKTLSDVTVNLRNHVDEYSKIILNDPAFQNIPEKTRKKIEENLGNYIHDTYLYFTDKSYKPSDAIKKEAYRMKAYEILSTNTNLTPEEAFKEAENYINELIEYWDKSRNPSTIIQSKGLNTSSIKNDADALKSKARKPQNTELWKKSLNAAKNKYPKFKSNDVRVLGLATEIYEEAGGMFTPLPQYLKDLLGQVKEPTSRYINTMLDLGSFIYKTQALNNISKIYENNGVLSSEPQNNKKDYTLINDKLSPLNGLWVNNAIIKEFENEPLYKTGLAGLDTYFKYSNFIRKMKIIPNPSSWFKNIEGGYAAQLLNGNFIAIEDPVAAAQALAGRFTTVFAGSRTDFVKEVFADAARAGVLSTGIDLGTLGDIDNMYRELSIGNDDKASKSLSLLAKKINKPLKEAGRRYAQIDDYTKAMAIYSEKYSQALKMYGIQYDSLSKEQQDAVLKRAGSNVKMGYPTFSRLPSWFKNVARMPFGNFMSFKFEAYRSFIGAANIMVNDINSAVNGVDIQGNKLNDIQRKEYAKTGAKRLLGMSAFIGAKVALNTAISSLILKGLFGDDDDDVAMKEALKELKPDWADDNIIIKDVDEKGNVKFYDYSGQDPYSGITSNLIGNFSNLKDFGDLGLGVKYLKEAYDGETSFGKKIYKKEDTTINKLAQGSLHVFEQGLIPTWYGSIKSGMYKSKQDNPEWGSKQEKTELILSRFLPIRAYDYNVYKRLASISYEMNDKSSAPRLNNAETDKDVIYRINNMVKMREAYKAANFHASNYFGNASNELITKVNKAEKAIKRNFSNGEIEFIQLADDEQAKSYVDYVLNNLDEYKKK